MGVNRTLTPRSNTPKVVVHPIVRRAVVRVLPFVATLRPVGLAVITLNGRLRVRVGVRVGVRGGSVVDR